MEANAFITLIGTEGVSDKHPLNLIGKTKFEPTSIETFSLETWDYGDIKKVAYFVNLELFSCVFQSY